jgi:chromosome segregation ATPase
MEIADLLYGVSMTEEGVSSIISQRLTEFKESEDRKAYAS